MNPLKYIKKEQVWLVCIFVGPVMAYLSVFYPAMSVLATIVLLIGLRGILTHIM